MSRYVTLLKWAQLTYGDDAPCYKTLLEWAHAGKIQPKPEKHGRTFFVPPDAVYTNRPLRLVDRLAREKENRAA